MRHSFCWWGVIAGACLFLPSLPARAADDSTPPASKDDARQSISLGLAPGTPQVGALPGGLTPAYGQRAPDDAEWRFDFHGFLTMPLRVGLNTRAGVATTEQHKEVLHAPPVTPDYRDSFTYTSIVPQPYTQLNFSYGNQEVTGNVVLLSRTATTAASFYNPPDQSGISDAFVNFRLPHLARNVHLDIDVGAFTNRYGVMGEYDEGRYGTPAIARLNGVGENIIAKVGLGNTVIQVEQGFLGQFDKFPNDVLPSGWNNFGNPNEGSGFVNHLHAGVAYLSTATVGFHYLFAWTQDDRASQSTRPDGKMTVLGTDIRLTTGNLGHLYFAAARASATNVGSVGRILEIMNTGGGQGLINNYLGPNSNGTGTLTTLAFQYDVSLQSILRYPNVFTGETPDLVLSLFGMQTRVTSDDKGVNIITSSKYDGVTKRKFGAEAGYSLLSWLAASFRFDEVMPDSNDSKQSFSIVSPRLIFRSKWQAHDQVVLQYSRFIYRSNVIVRSGYPAELDPSIKPDRDMISLSATMWW
ncbi:MAG TPA: hypothetical protein VH374_20880 [Polyangia bacterium]|jgi:hypothetical protein|nr:hypothetical protein [Polyangia bacterium]